VMLACAFSETIWTAERELWTDVCVNPDPPGDKSVVRLAEAAMSSIAPTDGTMPAMVGCFCL
jgi:hypothetical protein